MSDARKVIKQARDALELRHIEAAKHLIDTIKDSPLDDLDRMELALFNADLMPMIEEAKQSQAHIKAVLVEGKQ